MSHKNNRKEPQPFERFEALWKLFAPEDGTIDDDIGAITAASLPGEGDSRDSIMVRAHLEPQFDGEPNSGIKTIEAFAGRWCLRINNVQASILPGHPDVLQSLNTLESIIRDPA